MDPLYILENLQKARPAYQPIISAVTHDVIGYEVLGRFEHEGTWLSLGDFFHDRDVPDEFKAEVDQHLLLLAADDMLSSGNEGYLFINRNAQQLLSNGGEDFLHALRQLEQKGFPMARIVLEITEHDFEEDLGILDHLLAYYKTYGINIAIDHVGAKSSNIDRLRQLKPHILKIDTGLIRNYNTDVFQDVIYSLGVLARRIGAMFLYENIEDSHQLNFAWKHGGRYYQGYYLAKPDFRLLQENSLAINTKAHIQEFVSREKSRIDARLAFSLTWEEKVKKLLPHWHGPLDADRFIKKLTSAFEQESFRVYVCSSDGLQISSNFRKRQEQWEIEPQHNGSHWAFRPYFLENMMRMKTWHNGILSDTYSDIESGELIRTFSYPLSDQYFLFIDICPDFMTEKDYLLFQ
ncbi:EAL domain-containing protein [Planococcus lenghuensis]|uniref:Diguanylate cyclase n=1 Tax=Planococcus lenghuensis TaxID=2213202 RepID=A0A1Q2KW44_9BACL|nr:EAL domain-containing protein [Planococcus lenghuensis]AQQ52363.1 diguanylate cyclase [Planococcus lenghuensis]